MIEVHQYKTRKLLVALLEPLLLSALIAVLLFALPPNEKGPTPLSAKIFFAVILASLYVVPAAYLIYRHWKYGRHSKLTIDGTHFILAIGDNLWQFDKAAVNGITCYTGNSRTPWAWGCWWELVIDGKLFYLSCLMVPRSVMERYFRKK